MIFSLLDIRKIFFGALAFVCTAAAHAQSTPDAAMHIFLDGFDAGDLPKAASANSPSGTTIIDEFAPYTWTGARAFDEWGAALQATSKADGITEPKVSLGTAIVKNKTATQAYYIFPAVYTYKQKGTPMREPAHIAVAFRKEASDWKIVAWSWTGTVPKPVK